MVEMVATFNKLIESQIGMAEVLLITDEVMFISEY